MKNVWKHYTSKNKKAARVDSINKMLYKYLPVLAKYLFLAFANTILETNSNIISNSNGNSIWKKALVVPISKQGSQTQCENYRGISLLSAAYKIYVNILTKD